MWLRLVSVVVPRGRRAEWLAEWRAEVAHDGERAASAPPHGRSRRSLALGALAHALWLRRLEWTFTAADLRYAIRMVVRQPGFAAIVIATLAIGIGAATAMFTVVRGVLMKPLPYPEAERLVWMHGAFRQNDSAAVSPPDFLDYRERNQAFDDIGAMMTAPSSVTVLSAGGPERVRAATITAGLVTALGAPLRFGRDFTRDEERFAGPQATLISHRCWQERFAGRPDIVGQAVSVDGRPRTIVGVLPDGFHLPFGAGTSDEDVAFYLPFPFDVDEARVRGYHFLRLVGRLKPGVELTAAQGHMDVIAKDLEARYPENDTWKLRLVPLHERIVGDVRSTLGVLMAAVMLVLFVACANVAGLLLARGSSRQPEISVRRALGASRGRIVRQLLMEGLLLSAAGSLAGLVVAWSAVRAVRQISPINLPRVQELGLDPFVVAFAIVAGIGTTLLFAIMPVLQTVGRHNGNLPDGTRTAGSRGASRGRAVLVAGQVALSTLLLIGAGLLTRSFIRVTAIDPGFAVENVALAQVSLPPERYPQLPRVEQFYTALLARLSQLPGVEAASVATAPPLTGGNDISVRQDGAPKPAGRDRQFAQVRWVQGRYFEAAGVPVQAGRGFDDARDTPASPRVAIISKEMAEMTFSGQDPIGRRVLADFDTPQVAEVIGVAADARVFGQTVQAPPMLYFSARQAPTNYMSVVVRTATPAPEIAAMLRSAVRELDPDLAIGRIRTMEGLLAESVEEPRFRAGLIVSFAAVALSLTLIGLYGTLAYAVNQRTREIGIRLALGARSLSLLAMVLRQGAVLVAVGAVLGIVVALAATSLLQDMLFETTPRDPLVFVGVPVLLALVALAAMLIPARRASKVDPVRALRSA